MSSSFEKNIFYFLFKNYFKYFSWVFLFDSFLNGVTQIFQRLIFLTVVVIGMKIVLNKTQMEAEQDIFIIFDSYTYFIFLILLFGMPALEVFKIKINNEANAKWKNVQKSSKNPKIITIKNYTSSILELLFTILATFAVILIFGNFKIVLILILSLVIILLYRRYFFSIPLFPKFLKRAYLRESFSVYLGLSIFLVLLILYYALFPHEKLNIIYFFVICLFPRKLFLSLDRADKLYQKIIKNKNIYSKIL